MTQDLAGKFGELERESARVGRELRSTVALASRGGMSQRAIASRIHKSQPEVRRLASASSARAADGSPRRYMTARVGVDAANRELRAGDCMMAFKLLIQSIDHLGGLKDCEDIDEWQVAPAKVHHQGLDTLFQAVVRESFRFRGAVEPAWARPEPLDEEWVLAADSSRVARVRARTPAYLADLNVYVSSNDLPRV